MDFCAGFALGALLTICYLTGLSAAAVLPSAHNVIPFRPRMKAREPKASA